MHLSFCAQLPLIFAVALSSLFNSLDPLSVSEHLAFHELYPNTPEGKQALTHAWHLLSAEEEGATPLELPSFDIQAIVSLVTRAPFDPPVIIEEHQLTLIEKLSSSFANRTLKGSQIWDKQQLLELPSEEVDLGRALLLHQLSTREEIRQYEANLDLIALQIRARLSKNTPSAEEKIRAINRFIFEEMQFRFPPQSLSIPDIDLYTFLPSVLDSRKGVCLGVSILYLCLAQRLNLPLEIITPPGHIYVRYQERDQLINIETTARGIHMPNEQYLGINTRKLQQRTMKEVIGMAFVNEASVYLGRQEYKKTAELYDKARPFLPDDPLLDLLQGCSYLFIGKVKEGKQLLQKIRGFTFDHAVSEESIPQDFLSGKIDIEGVKAVFLPVDETRESITLKQRELQKMIDHYPKYRAGLLQLAITWLQLGRTFEGQKILDQYHQVDPHDATVEYYLSVISLQRLDYNKAWHHLKSAEALVEARAHHPKALLALRAELKRLCPPCD